MKKTLLKSALMALAGVGLMAGSASATAIVSGGESPDLQTIFDTKGWDIDVDDDQAPYDSYWEVSEGVLSGSWTTLLIEVAGNAGANTFGVFDQSGKMYKLFDGSAGTLDKNLYDME